MFLKVAPELVFELRSPSDTAPALAKRADEWVAAGVSIAIVLDPVERAAFIHEKPGTGISSTSGILRLEKALLPGATGDLVLDLAAIFDADL